MNLETEQELQQGDVHIKKVDYKIKGEKLNTLVVAEGESTGHRHELINGLGTLIMMDKIMHLNVLSDQITLKHEEHNKIEIPKGDYQIKIRREYDHFEEEAKLVRD